MLLEIASSMCQMRRPLPGRLTSLRSAWRFSTRKYSWPAAPSFQSRYTVWESLTSGIDRVPFVVTFSTVTHACWALHHADGCVGV